jgi:ABC-type phosphate transport system substrate-binding protein
MRNFKTGVIVLFCLGLLGCGSGGGNATVPAATTPSSNTTEKGTITISLSEAPVAKDTEKTVAALPVPTKIKVCVYNSWTLDFCSVL